MCSRQSYQKIYLGQDPDPEILESQIWFRIRAKMVRISNFGSMRVCLIFRNENTSCDRTDSAVRTKSKCLLYCTFRVS
jgi:hypothetical protein